MRAGPYVPGAELAEGGTATVYDAVGPGGPVVLKVLRRALSDDPRWATRFERELDALTRLAHPAVLAVLDHGVTDDGRPYLVLPKLEGRTLRALLDARGALPANAVDMLLVTTHANLPWDAWMKVLDLEGTLCLIGVPSQPLTLGVDPLLDEQKRVTGSVVGSSDTMRRMLALAAERGIAPITERMPMARVNDAVARVREGKARLRVVLDV